MELNKSHTKLIGIYAHYLKPFVWTISMFLLVKSLYIIRIDANKHKLKRNKNLFSVFQKIADILTASLTNKIWL